MRYTNTGVRGRASFLLIACERSGKYKPKKKDLVRTYTGSRKSGCLFKFRAKPILGEEGWMVKLICGTHNYEITKSFVEHPYAGRLTKDEKIVVADMTKSMDSIENIIDVKVNCKCGYRAIVALLGMGEDSWSLVRNHLHKELISWLEEYINLLGGIERFEELKRFLLVDRLFMVTIDKWMNITDMEYVITSRYNVIVVSLLRQQNMTFFPLRSQPPPDSSMHRVICIVHVYENHFFQVFLTRLLSFTTIGVIVEYTLPVSGKVVAHPIHR
ncbi:uncharacterized protein LOC114424025 [Glycine soja]|uniref:uncharacterized protein LOC114424025 n=1 Tax=Glycine soja TaxID=3848 RepID=UPI00103B208A|nr:uncharacterized protein LOC114424025 [Glycine soja]